MTSLLLLMFAMWLLSEHGGKPLLIRRRKRADHRRDGLQRIGCVLIPLGLPRRVARVAVSVCVFGRAGANRRRR